MIVDGILFVVQGFLNVLLLPLACVDVAVDFVSSIPVITQFLQVVAYVLPWSNILPLIVLTIGTFLFRIAVSLIKTVWNLIPFV